MQVLVCSRTQVSRFQSRHNVTHILSQLDPGKRPFLHPQHRPKWLLQHFEDNIDADQPLSPTRQHCEQFLDWAKNIPADGVLLVHCEAGVSRSTASALCIMVQERGVDKIDDCIEALVAIRPVACPNPVITKFCDEILGCGGELHAKAEALAEAKLIKKFGKFA